MKRVKKPVPADGHVTSEAWKEGQDSDQPTDGTEDSVDVSTLTETSRARAPAGWKGRFLAALEKSGSVTDAVRAGNVSRDTAYAHRESDRAFAAAWAEVVESVTDRIEARAVEMSTDGLERAVWHKGQIVGYEREVDAGTVQFMLRSRRRATYGDKLDMTVTGQIAHLHTTAAEMERLMRERAPLLAERLAQLKRIGPKPVSRE